MLIKRVISIFCFSFACLAFLVPAFSAHAVDPGGIICAPTDVSDEGSEANSDVYICVNNVYRYSIVIGSIMAVMFIVIAGYLYMFSGGSDANVSTAKSLISSSLLGVAILLGGFLLLKQVNPELLKIKTISPQRIPGSDWSLPTFGNIYSGSSGGTGNAGYSSGAGGAYSGGAGVPGSNSGPANHNAGELACGYQGSKANYVRYMTETLFQTIKQICAEVKSKGLTAVISSISTGHIGTGSLHTRGCAVDFAGGGMNPGYMSSPVGQAILEAAKKTGAVINPGGDANQTFHIHVDVGSKNCTAPVLPLSAQQ